MVEDVSGVFAPAAGARVALASPCVVSSPVRARRFVAPHASPAKRKGCSASLVGPAAAEQLARDRLHALALRFGMQGGFYVHFGHGLHGVGLAKPVRFVATSVADKRFYLEDGGLGSDPAMPRAATALTPFAWTTGVTGTASDTQRWLAVRHKGRGICGGIAVPVQDYAAGPACLNLFSAFSGEVENLIAVRGPELLYAAASFHEDMKHVLAAPSAGARQALTAREIECLRLAALGWSGNETAEALGLTPRTVEFHLKNAADKFGAPNKLRAVALAVAQGLIAP